MIELITTDEAREGFYPTPEAMGDKLLAGLDWDMIQTVLEPSAGKGNLVDCVAAARYSGRFRGRRSYDSTINVDCIEIDPYLRSILQYEYGGAHEKEIRDRLRVLSDKQEYNCVTRERGQLTSSEKVEEHALEAERDKRHYTDFHIVHDDFLTFTSRKSYDLIVMNPPFANGDEHLLKAIEIQSQYGGMIRCIINAETILNPYTNRRKLLKRKLEELSADVSFVEGGFSCGERSTDVTVAIIKIDIPTKREESDIYDRLRKAAEVKEEPAADVTELAVSDSIRRIVSQFNVEVDAGLTLIREYNAMRPYILESLADKSYNEPTLTLCVGDPSRTFRGTLPSVNKFVELTRKKYWEAFFTRKEYVGKLTSNLRKKYFDMADSMKNYDFSLFNIQQIMLQMNAEMCQGIQDTIVSLFDRMTEQHTWYPECEKNVHYYNGWKTNKAHKINKKVILPVNGMFSTYSWEKADNFSLETAEKTIGDIEKAFDYLDGNMSSTVELHGVLERAHAAGQTRNIPCKYFDVTLYKKGTMHIRFRNQALVDRFNIYCSQRKNWLPPSYGRTTYTSMTDEEKAVVDGFNGDGTEGSGEKAYAEIQRNQAYYLAEPTQNILAIGAAPV